MNTQALTSTECHSHLCSLAPCKWKKIKSALLVIFGLGCITLIAVGYSQDWWKESNLHIYMKPVAYTLVSLESAAGITLFVLWILEMRKKKDAGGKGLVGLINEVADSKGQPFAKEHHAALRFALEKMNEHPDIKPFEWKNFKENGYPVNQEIPILLAIHLKMHLKKSDEIEMKLKKLDEIEKTDDKDQQILFFDSTLKLYYAIFCLVCDDMPALKSKLSLEEEFTFCRKESYQSEAIFLVTRMYQFIRFNMYADEAKVFYEEGTIQNG